MIAVQEAAIHRDSEAPACPGRAGYTLVYGSGRAVMYIRKNHGPEAWTAEAGADWCKVYFHAEDLTIWNIYHPPATDPTEGPIRIMTEAASTPGQHIILGDFNLHNPSWDEFGRTSPCSTDLLEIATRSRIDLLTPPGDATRFQGDNRPSTIDLIWASRDTPARFQGPDDDLIGSDHVAQRVDYGTERHTTTMPRRIWRDTHEGLASREAAYRFGPRDQMAPLRTPAEVDQYADSLMATLEQIVEIAVPTTDKPPRISDFKDWWTQEVKTAHRNAKTSR